MTKNTNIQPDSKEYNQTKTLLSLCKNITAESLEVIACLKNYSNRFKLRELQTFDLNIKFNLNLPQLLGLWNRTDKTVLQQCAEDGILLNYVEDVIVSQG